MRQLNSETRLQRRSVVQPPLEWGRKLSTVVAIVPFSVISFSILTGDQRVIESNDVIWPLVLIVLALSLISPTISFAFQVADEFASTTKEFLKNPGGGRFLRHHREMLDSPVAALIGALFALLGVTISVLMPDKSLEWRFIVGFTISTTFYFTGFGLWATWNILR